MKNTGQTPSASPRSFTGDQAQAFTTGGNAGGYRVTGLLIRMRETGTTPAYTVAIHGHIGGDGIIHPSPLYTFTNPASLPTSWGNASFTAPGDGFDLQPDTTYWVVMDTNHLNASTKIAVTETADEDGGLAGWSIADTQRVRTAAATSWPIGASFVRANPLMLGLRGHANTAPGVPTGLSVSAGTNSGELSVTWTAPTATGTGITDYDLRVFQGGTDPSED
ncbi:MAG: fibronectin type III domain-containing protein, partial [Chloroflexi bacterium]|nr:fibronectin type III domain-containing protein [Chloroflexota bacterium]